MSDYVKSLSTILQELINEGATDEPGRYQQRVDALASRFRQLLQSIQETSQRCSVIIPSKLFDENSSKLIEELNRMNNVSNACRTLEEVHSAVQQQNRLVEHFKQFQGQLDELLRQGNDLLRQPMVPKYVQQNLQTLQKLYQDKTQSAQEMLKKLKVDPLRNCFEEIFDIFFSVWPNSGKHSIEINVDINNNVIVLLKI